MSTKSHYGLKDLEKDFGPLTFADMLESYRLSEELPQKDFALILGISPQSVCDLEKGRKIPSPRRAARIAQALKEPPTVWIQVALQDLLNHAQLKYRVIVQDNKPGQKAA